MWEFVLASENTPFAIALALMLLIALFEGVGVLLGAGVSQLLDSLIPDFEAQTGLDAGESGLSRLLGWLKLGRVPVLVLLVVFLTTFGLIGYAVQYLAATTFGGPWPAALAVLPALVGALPLVRMVGSALERLLPQDESSAVTTASFVGRIATVTLGTAREERAAEARLSDQYGTTHYVQVRPERGHSPLVQGSRVLLVRQDGAQFIAIENNDNLLQD